MDLSPWLNCYRHYFRLERRHPSYYWSWQKIGLHQHTSTYLPHYICLANSSDLSCILSHGLIIDHPSRLAACLRWHFAASVAHRTVLLWHLFSFSVLKDCYRLNLFQNHIRRLHFPRRQVDLKAAIWYFCLFLSWPFLRTPASINFGLIRCPSCRCAPAASSGACTSTSYSSRWSMLATPGSCLEIPWTDRYARLIRHHSLVFQSSFGRRLSERNCDYKNICQLNVWHNWLHFIWILTGVRTLAAYLIPSTLSALPLRSSSSRNLTAASRAPPPDFLRRCANCCELSWFAIATHAIRHWRRETSSSSHSC